MHALFSPARTRALAVVGQAHGRTNRWFALALVSLLASALLALPTAPASAGTTSGNLPGGTSIDVGITAPAHAAVVTPGAVTVTGTASVGEGVPVANTALVTVVDVSGSTEAPASCGGDANGDGLTNRVLDCEVAAAVALNNAAVSNGTIADVAAVVFGNSAAIADVGPASGHQTLTAPGTDGNANGQNDMEEVLRSTRSSGRVLSFTPYFVDIQTNFEAGVNRATAAANASSKPNKLVAFLSDGTATRGGSAIDDATAAAGNGIRIETFAVGSGSSCTDTGTSAQGSLQQIAAATGGTCTRVTDPADLAGVLPGVIGSKLTSLSMTIDGSPATIDTISPALPQAGPANVNFSTTTPALSPGTHTICVSAHGSDGGGSGNVTDCHDVVVNAPPSADAGGPYSGDEGSAIALAGAVADSDGPSLTAAWSYAPVSGVDAGATCTLGDASAVSTTVTCTDDGNYELTLTADDGVNAPVTSTTALSVANVAPTASVSAPGFGALYAVGSSVALTVGLADAGTNDTHSCSVNWDDGTTSAGSVSESAGTGTCAASQTFTTAGVYSIVATVTDDDGAATTATTMVVVYDPDAGFVTGGGWLDSPAGAYRTDPTAAGRANFGFVSKYQRGATKPSGQTEFQFKAGNLNFHSSDYQWLVVSGAKAQYKGTGTINGTPGYGFLLTATDGQQTGGGGTDKLRMKIWELSTDQIVYDNAASASDDIDASDTQAISGGSIVIHSGR